MSEQQNLIPEFIFYDGDGRLVEDTENLYIKNGKIYYIFHSWDTYDNWEETAYTAYQYTGRKDCYGRKAYVGSKFKFLDGEYAVCWDPKELNLILKALYDETLFVSLHFLDFDNSEITGHIAEDKKVNA